MFLSRRIPSRTNRWLGLAPTDFFDGRIQVAEEVRRDVSLRVGVGARGHRDATGEHSREGPPLPPRGAVDEGMLEEHSMFRRPRPGPQMPEESALRSQQLDGARRSASEFLDASRQRDEPRGDEGSRELGHIRRELSDGSLYIRFDGFPSFRDSSLKAMRSRSSGRIFQSSTRLSRSAMAFSSFGKSRWWTTVPSSRRNEPNQVVTSSTLSRKGSVGKSVCAQRAFLRFPFFEVPVFGRSGAFVTEPSWAGFQMPVSVMKPVMYFAGVTSKAGFRAGLSFGAIGCPSRWRTSCGDSSSIGM